MDIFNSLRKGNFRHARDKFCSQMLKATHPSIVGMYRIFFSFVMLQQWEHFARDVIQFPSTTLLVPYSGWKWVPFTTPFGYLTVCLIGYLSAITLLIGLFTRLSSIVLFFTFTYIFIQDQANYNNHYLFISHILFLFIFLDLRAWASLDLLISPHKSSQTTKTSIPTSQRPVPFWQVLALRLIICVPYFYGGLAKLNPDWLFHFQPIAMWFQYRRPPLNWHITHIFLCLTGCLFDLSISFFLLNKHTRFWIGFPGAISFNVMNNLMFHIGVFPILMIYSTALFLDPHHPAAILSFLLRKVQHACPTRCVPWLKSAIRYMSYSVEPNASFLQGTPSTSATQAIPEYTQDLGSGQETQPLVDGWGGGKKPRSGGTWVCMSLLQRVHMVLFVSWLCFHAVFPLRQKFMFKGEPAWTEEGHIGAWHMKLRSKTGHLVFRVLHNTNSTQPLEEVYYTVEDHYLMKKQRQKYQQRTHPTLRYAGHLQRMLRRQGREPDEIRIKSCFSLNNREPRELFMDVNILPYVNTYEHQWSTGIGKFLYTWRQAPRCDPLSSDTLGQYKEESKVLYNKLYGNVTLQHNTYQPDSLWQRWVLFSLQFFDVVPYAFSVRGAKIFDEQSSEWVYTYMWNQKQDGW